MPIWKERLYRLFQSAEARRTGELERMAELKQDARARRMEYAAEVQQEERAGVTPSPDSLASRKRRVQEAEGRYALASQAWDNKQWRIKGR